MKIAVYNHASIKLKEEKTIYIDPYNIENNYNDADYIFITHDHYDHFDEESINKVKNKETKIIIPKAIEEQTKNITPNVLVVEPNETYEIDNIKFDTIESYNINKQYHPKENKNVGYNISINKKRYYIMGDTDRTKETDEVKTDVCFVPIGGTFTMDVKEAIEYINYIKPKKAIPIHYGSLVGAKSLGEEFKAKIDKNIEVELLIN